VISDDSSITEVVVGGAWIFSATLAVSASGFILWVIISRLLGVEVVGVTSAAVSAAGVASTLVAAGLPLAVMREFAAKGIEALKPAASVTLALGAASAAVAALMVAALPSNFSIPYWVPPALSLMTVASMVGLQALIGLGRFAAYFTSTLTASLAKVIVGIGLALLGWGTLAPLLGYVSYPITALLTTTYFLATTYLTRPRNDPSSSNSLIDGASSLLKLAYSNYPFLFSTQILNMLSVYFFAVLTGKAVDTGTLYLSLMIVLILNAVVGSALNASLSVSLRRGTDPFTDTLRLALAIAAPIATAVSVAPLLPLHLINPALVKGASTLALLTLTIPPTAVATAALVKANKEGRHSTIAALGIVRLTTLLALLPPLARIAGTDGVALAYLAANITPLPIAVKEIPGTLKTLTVTWGTQTMLTLATLTLTPNPTPTQAVALALTAAATILAATHATKTANLKEIAGIITTIARKALSKQPT